MTMQKEPDLSKMTKPDVLLRLKDLHKQATIERSHFYVGSVVHDAIDEIESAREAIVRLTVRVNNLRDELMEAERGK